MDGLDLGGQRLHGTHALDLPPGERDEDDPDNDGENHDRPGEAVESQRGEGREKAAARHRSLGEWLLRKESTVARFDPDVRAVVLRIDSPGGSVFASEQIYREVAAIKAAGKPVVVVALPGPGGQRLTYEPVVASVTVGSRVGDGDLIVSGRVTRSVVVVHGNAVISGRVRGDVVALTGRVTSPPIFDVLAVLGKSESLGRLRDQMSSATANNS